MRIPSNDVQQHSTALSVTDSSPNKVPLGQPVLSWDVEQLAKLPWWAVWPCGWANDPIYFYLSMGFVRKEVADMYTTKKSVDGKMASWCQLCWFPQFSFMNHINQLISPQWLNPAMIDETPGSGPFTSTSTASPDMFDAFNTQLQTSEVKTKLTLQASKPSSAIRVVLQICKMYGPWISESVLELSPMTSGECISVGQIHVAAPSTQKDEPVLSTRTELLSQKYRWDKQWQKLQGFEADTTTR